MNAAQKSTFGYVCPVRGCKNRNNRRFQMMGLCMHIIAIHGEKELAKRLRTKEIVRRDSGVQDLSVQDGGSTPPPANL